MILAIAAVAVLGLVLGWLLGLAGRYLSVEGNPIEEEVAAMMPGSQCGQCRGAGAVPDEVRRVDLGEPHPARSGQPGNSVSRAPLGQPAA